MSALRLTEPASDWIGHTIEGRLTHCAQALYVHGEISPDEFRRITSGIAHRARNESLLIRRKQRPWWRRTLKVSLDIRWRWE